MLRNTLWLLLVLGAFALGVLLTRQFSDPLIEQKQETSADVLLERVRSVAKLVTVEGYFSEIYNYKDYYNYDISLLRKKALLRVKAKVSVGYDLNQVQFETQPDARELFIRNLPAPTIIAIEHDIDYYDIAEGAFNSFSEEDYNRLNRDAKDYIREKARESILMEEAKAQGVQLLEVMRYLAEASGWEVVIEGRAPELKNKDKMPDR